MLARSLLLLAGRSPHVPNACLSNRTSGVLHEYADILTANPRFDIGRISSALPRGVVGQLVVGTTHYRVPSSPSVFVLHV